MPPLPSNRPLLPTECDLLVLHARLHCEDAKWSNALEQILDVFPARLQERIRRQRRVENRCAQILDKLLLLGALALWGVQDATLDNLSYDSCGRPSMEEGIDFSLSHSGGSVVCATGTAGRVGIDVEKVREIRIQDFAGVFAARSWLRVQSAERSTDAFFREWTQLEAVLKADGRGLRNDAALVESDGRRAYLSSRCWYLHEVVMNDEYACCVAGSLEDPRIIVRACEWDGRELQIL
jgi:4'-phosphopantetheinyl transferase